METEAQAAGDPRGGTAIPGGVPRATIYHECFIRWLSTVRNRLRPGPGPVSRETAGRLRPDDWMGCESPSGDQVLAPAWIFIVRFKKRADVVHVEYRRCA
jgi:hypothetical protein